MRERSCGDVVLSQDLAQVEGALLLWVEIAANFLFFFVVSEYRIPHAEWYIGSTDSFECSNIVADNFFESHKELASPSLTTVSQPNLSCPIP